MKLTNTLLSHDYEQSKYDYSLFVKKEGDKFVYMLVYVDDLLITGSDNKLIQQLKETLMDQFSLKDLGPLRYFLGVEVARSPEGIVLN